MLKVIAVSGMDYRLPHFFFDNHRKPAQTSADCGVKRLPAKSIFLLDNLWGGSA
jgi:hypothetical protein